MVGSVQKIWEPRQHPHYSQIYALARWVVARLHCSSFIWYNWCYSVFKAVLYSVYYCCHYIRWWGKFVNANFLNVIELNMQCLPLAWLCRTSPTTSIEWRTSTPGGVFARHQRAHLSCLWRACQQSETAHSRWPQFACETVCRPMSLCRHRCRHSRDGWRQNCLFGAIHSSAASDTLFFTACAAHMSFRFFLFCFVRCPSSLWHYATLISFVH